MGYSKKEINKMNLMDYIHPDSKDHFMNLFKKIVSGKRVKNIQVKFVKKNGKSIDVEGNAVSISKKGKTISIWGAFRDITERTKSELALKQSEQKYKSIFNSAIDGIITINLKGKITSINSTGLEISGLKEKKIIGKDFSKLKIVNLKELPVYLDLFKKAIKGEKLDSFKTKWVNLKGEKITSEIRPAIIRKGKKITGIQIMFRDITQREEYELLKKETKAQKELENLRSNFLMMLTHEMKQPITPILGYAGLLEAEVESEQGREYLNRIIDNSYRMRDLINKILTLLRLEAGVLKLDINPYDINPIIEDVLDVKSSAIKLKNIRITKKLVKAKLKIDRNRINDVLINLMDNAIKFSKDDGIIEIKSKINKDEYILSIKDYGIGIRKEDIPKLFIKFYQTEDGKKLGGSGIGLAMIKELLKAHNGKVQVRSEYKKGTEFIIKLPI